MKDAFSHIADLGTEGQLISAEIAGGEVNMFTMVSPGKETPNEDSVGVFSYGPAAAVLAVADGAGGMPAGHRASSTAVQVLHDSMQSAMNQTQLLRTAVLNGIEAANVAILEHGNGSATTLTVVTVEGSTARCYHVGDSPAWILGQRGRLRFEAIAHSPVGLAVEAGFLSERDAMFHPDRHIVSNFLGTADMRIEVSPEIGLARFDTVVIGSDGLNDNLYYEEIVEFIRCGPLRERSAALIAAAHTRMLIGAPELPCKPDDLSVVTFRRGNRSLVKEN